LSAQRDFHEVFGGYRDLSRRQMLKRMGVGAGAMSLGAFLAACGVEGDNENESDPAARNELVTTQRTGEFVFANWPLYIDKAQGRRPTIDDFTQATDIKVEYKEVIEDNESFFGTINEPLSNDSKIEYDLIVVTDWLITKMGRLGYLEELDHSKLSQFEAHAAEIYKDPGFDPGNAYSIPWQSGITGIGYNPKLTGRELTSFEDLFDPAFEGKVGMFKEMRDTMNLTLLGLGIDTAGATVADAEKAQAKLLEQREAGIVRQYYGNEYTDALIREDLWVTMAWSGDIFQLQFDKPELEFIVPEEGGILWVDNMAIPDGSEHPIDAMEFMNFVYDPKIAAQIASWVNYICPVPEAQEIIRQQAADQNDDYLAQVAESPLVFPTDEMSARVHSYADLSEEDETAWNDLFGEVIQG
jgi:spermidine/putrescine transport system substrate-binding protein